MFPAFSQIIVLNGPCCAGKYSIAEKMVEKLRGEGQYWVHFSVKDCHRKMWQEIHQEKEKDPIAYINEMHQKIKKSVELGKNVIVDHVFSNEDVFAKWLLVLREFRNIKYVWVFCSKETADLRANKVYQNEDLKLALYSIGVHFNWYEKIKSFKQGSEYAQEIGSDHLSIDQCAQQIIQKLGLN